VTRGLIVALRRFAVCVIAVLGAVVSASANAGIGYYRYPALAGDTVVFTAEGDLWSVPLAGGQASRLTTHLAEETNATTSADGKWLAFAAAYDGPTEVYVMPLTGGSPRRVSFEGTRSVPVGWTPAGEVLYITQSPTGPSREWIAIAVDPTNLHRHALPLADISDAAMGADGHTLYFTRFGLITSLDNVHFYRGGLLSRLWRFDLDGGAEAQLVADHADDKDRHNDRRPMPWGDRLYFISDRDGRDNLWSMALDGSDPRQLTHEADFDVRTASLDQGRIVFQAGADLYLYDIASGAERKLTIDLLSDFDQEREHLVKKPLDFFENADFAPSGERVAVTARGRVALMGVGPLRRIDIATPPTARAGSAVVSPDGRWVYAIVEDGTTAAGDDAGAPQIWRFAADGGSDKQQLTTDDAGHRWGLWLSPDGKWLAHATTDGRLFLLDIEKGENQLIDTAEAADLHEIVAWSSDSRHLAFARSDSNVDRAQIFLYEPATQTKARLTSDRYNSRSPTFTPDGKWLYFLSDRQFESSNRSPWGDRNMGPFFDRRTKIYALALQADLRFPFQPKDELTPAEPATKDGDKTDEKPAADKDKKPAPLPVRWEGLADRLYEVPLMAGNYAALQTDGKLLYFLDEIGTEGRATLKTLKISNDNEKPQDFLGDVREFALSADRKKLFLRRWAADNRIGDMFIVPAGAKPPDNLSKAPTEIGKAKGEIGRTSGDFGKMIEDLDKVLVRASDWSITVDPKAEWRQMFGDAWRLHRDFFFDRDMHGVDWLKIREKYRPLVERVADRAELNDLLAQMMAELGALHSQVVAGDLRTAPDGGRPAFLGAVLAAEPTGARIVHIYRSDVELPDERSPLARTGIDAREGDVISAVDGRAVTEVNDISELLVGKAGEQVLLTLKRTDPQANGTAPPEREIKIVVKPVDSAHNTGLRYGDWEEGRRAVVEAASGGRIGYLHLRAMGPEDIAAFAREFYAQYDRDGLIIDVRRNNGGNIDSWVIEKLLRRAWAVWRPRYGTRHQWNMQQSFRGHLAVLIDESTYSDGEAFAAGIKALGLGPLIGTRTAGAGVWLREDTKLSDRGWPRVAEYPVFAASTGELLVENKGVEPDIVVENLPHATFAGEDAQLDAAIHTLQEKLKSDPVPPL
jgi:tricorn protease